MYMQISTLAPLPTSSFNAISKAGMEQRREKAGITGSDHVSVAIGVLCVVSSLLTAEPAKIPDLVQADAR